MPTSSRAWAMPAIVCSARSEGAMPDFILSIDQGTTSTRAILFDLKGEQQAVAQKELPQIFPQPGWVEHDPKEILRTQRETMREAVTEEGVAAEDVAAMG